MTPFVVDTNVAIAANGGGAHVDESCRLICVQRLRSVVQGEVVAIDEKGSILEEYARHLCYSGSPGMGDAFLKHVFDHQYRNERVQRVSITPSDNHQRGFEELPENTLDPSDRKFLAVAVVAKAVVLNATDSDWGEHRAFTESLGVEVSQLCPQHASRKS